jgi:hypothetical protein
MSKNFPKIQEPPPISRRQKDETKQEDAQFGVCELMHTFCMWGKTAIIMLKILGAVVQNWSPERQKRPGFVRYCYNQNWNIQYRSSFRKYFMNSFLQMKFMNCAPNDIYRNHLCLSHRSSLCVFPGVKWSSLRFVLSLLSQKSSNFPF